MNNNEVINKKNETTDTQINDIFNEFNHLLFFTCDFYEYKVIQRNNTIKELNEKIYNQELQIQYYASIKSTKYYLFMLIKKILKTILFVLYKLLKFFGVHKIIKKTFLNNFFEKYDIITKIKNR